MKKLLISVFVMLAFSFGEDGTLSISSHNCAECTPDNVGNFSSTIDVYMTNTADVYGFQFTIIADPQFNAEFSTTGEGGLAGDMGFAVSVSPTTGLVLGFSFTGAYISAQAGDLLTTLTLTTDNVEGYFDIDITNIAGIGGTALSFEVGAPFLATDEPILVEEYSLSNNYPNPFNPSTTINYAVKDAGDVTLIIYDMLGREVNVLVNDYLQPNTYSIVWDGLNMNGQQVASGVYYYKMVANDFIDTKKMLFVK